MARKTTKAAAKGDTGNDNKGRPQPPMTPPPPARTSGQQGPTDKPPVAPVDTDKTIDLEPNLVSILVGVNDLWHKFDGRYTGSVADFEQGYRELLEQTRQALPQATIVLCEPFVLRTGVVSAKWFPEFDQRRAVAGRLAREYQTRFVPFQSNFDRALADDSAAAYWTADGVHPTAAGHQLLADAWLAAVTG